MKKNSLSVIISAYNEEKNIEDCLRSVAFADQIIVVDNSSSDKTAQLAKKFTKYVYKKPNNLMLNINKNFGFTKATNEWILSLDADERVDEALATEIQETIEDTQKTGFWIPRKNIIFGKWIQHSLWWPDYQLRLFRAKHGSFAQQHVHEMLTVDGETGKLIHPIVHYNYQTVTQFIYKMDKIYTESEVENILSSGKYLTWVDAIRMPANDFIKTFLFQKGYKDGLHGLVLSMFQAMYAEVVFAKVWERQGFPEYNQTNFLHDVLKELQKVAREWNYWVLTNLIELSTNTLQKIRLKLKRKTL